jgi:uncharacterized protein (TIGR03083 family)
MSTTHPDLTRTEIIDGALREYEDFAALVASLSDAEWQAASRCDGWEARDVAGHVIGLAEDVAKGVPGSRNADEEAASIRILAPAEAAGHLTAALDGIRALTDALDDDAAWSAPSPVPDLTMGEGILTLWYDTYVHAEDIRDAAGRPPAKGPGLAAAVAYLEAELTKQGWAGTVADDVAPHDFVLAATGRIDPGPLGLDETVNIYRVQ